MTEKQGEDALKGEIQCGLWSLREGWGEWIVREPGRTMDFRDRGDHRKQIKCTPVAFPPQGPAVRSREMFAAGVCVQRVISPDILARTPPVRHRLYEWLRAAEHQPSVMSTGPVLGQGGDGTELQATLWAPLTTGGAGNPLGGLEE